MPKKPNKQTPFRKFDVRKYQNENFTLLDGSDALANERQLVISFYHVPSGRSVFFKAFITAFNESYNSNFTPNETFGRTDPIYQYKNTTRKITLAFKVPAASEGEAYENLGKVSALEQMLYPNYTEVNSATTLAQAPLIRVKVMNLLTSNYSSGIPRGREAGQLASGDSEPRKVFYNSYNSDSDPKKGLLGVIDNLAVNHNLEGDDGVFFKRREIDGVARPVNNTILPKFIDINVAFSPIHERTLGWNENDKAKQPLFPYGVITDDTNPIRLEEADKNHTTYNEQQEKDKAAAQERELRQQTLDNGRARYGGVLGDMRMRSDIRRTGRGNERAGERVTNYLNAELDEAVSGFDAAIEDLEGFIES